MSQLPPLKPIESSALQGFHHDPNTQKLTIQYHGKDGAPGDVWQYDGVGVDKVHELEHSASPGRVLATRIKTVHPGRKLT